ncbi:Teichuronic acid biosynthesis protein TuaB [Rubripirellula lacrimiformis]|uniref:Teichuronic acid biosynthesis protein TuaB n=2 Tax=Rubripirellula lacrimiformis TaxID=1930273 RepID=A0A517N8R2_9BACT|nr:Teichuronic acid biosynthesis protein TuaB [Rubripirellula lacrimiformis]
MMSVFIALGGSLMDSGLSQALIRLPDAKQVDFNTAFYSNICFGVLSYALLFLTAPLVANFYAEPRLTALIRVASISILISSLRTVQEAQLTRELNFRLKVLINLPSGIIAGLLAIGLALKGFGVWSLVAQSILTALLSTLLLWHFQKWRPTAVVSGSAFEAMFAFGYKLFLSGFLDTVFNNLYVVVIAKVFSGPVAGIYYFATRLADLVIQNLYTSIQAVTYPALATVQNDDKRLKSGFRKTIVLTTFALFPCMLLLAALAHPFIVFFLDSKWLPAATMLPLLCLAKTLYPVHAVNLAMLKVKGRSDLFLGLEIFKKLMITAVLFFSFRLGIQGILYGQILCSLLAFAPNSYFSSSLLGYTLKEQASDVLPNLALAMLVSIACYFASAQLDWAPFYKLVALGGGALITYAATAYFLSFQAVAIIASLKSKRIAS